MTSADAEIEKRTLRAAADWHAVWAVGFVILALFWPTAGDVSLNDALGVAAVPGIVGQLTRLPGARWLRFLVAVSWPLAIGAAIAMTGGLAGPLAALALMPAVGAATLSGGRFIAIGAALTTATIAAIALVTTLHLITAPAVAGPWLPLAMVGVSAIALAAALQLARARGTESLEAQARETARLKTLLESGPLLMLRLDREGVIREVFCGAPEDWDLKLVGRPFENLAGEAHRGAARAALELVRKGGQASVGFAPPLAPDRFLAVDMRGLQQGEIVALVRDATRERATEAWLEQGKADAEATARAKSRFLANMSHELRTPLNAIIGFSDIMRSRLFGPMEGRYAEYAALIHESGGHLLDLINDVLDMSKIEAERFSLSLEPFDAREAVAAALRLTRVQADTARIQLRGALPPTPLEVNADRRALKQIVLNLVSNALKFTPAGGQVNVIARGEGEVLEIIVADTGVGISRADLERLGKPYEQAGGPEQRAMGTGLGLSLVRAFAELHGGTMTIKSLLGEGTVVSVKMPVMDTALTLQAPPASEPPPSAPEPPPILAAAGGGDNVIAFRPQR